MSLEVEEDKGSRDKGVDKVELELGSEAVLEVGQDCRVF